MDQGLRKIRHHGPGAENHGQHAAGGGAAQVLVKCSDAMAWPKSQGKGDQTKGDQTRINAILRDAMLRERCIAPNEAERSR